MRFVYRGNKREITGTRIARNPRAALGAGVALLISTKLDDCQRRAAGLALAIVGLLTTIPFAVRLLDETD